MKRVIRLVAIFLCISSIPPSYTADLVSASLAMGYVAALNPIVGTTLIIGAGGAFLLFQSLRRSNHHRADAPKSKGPSKAKGNTGGPCTCGCGCFRPTCTCGCRCICGNICGKGEVEKERKINEIEKPEFFNNPRIKSNYEHYRKEVYRLKPNGTPVAKNAEYLHWDKLHKDVEVYSKTEKHLGSLDPKTLKLYKPPIPGREFPEK